MNTVASTSNDILMPSFLTATTIGINEMPPELLMKMFSLLDNEDLANVVSVCTRWRDVGEGLWNWDLLIIGKGDLEMMEIKRVNHVKCVDIDCTEFWSAEPEKLNQFFKSVTRLSKLTRLTVDDLCLTSLRPSLFVDAVINIHSVDLQCTVLTGEQLNMLFSNMNENFLKKKYFGF